MKTQTQQTYALSMAGTPFIDALIANGIISAYCASATIHCRAGHPITVSQELYVEGGGLDQADTIRSLSELAKTRTP